MLLYEVCGKADTLNLGVGFGSQELSVSGLRLLGA